MSNRDLFRRENYCTCGIGSRWGAGEPPPPPPPVERVRQGALVLSRCTGCGKWTDRQ